MSYIQVTQILEPGLLTFGLMLGNFETSWGIASPRRSLSSSWADHLLCWKCQAPNCQNTETFRDNSVNSKYILYSFGFVWEFVAYASAFHVGTLPCLCICDFPFVSVCSTHPVLLFWHDRLVTSNEKSSCCCHCIAAAWLSLTCWISSESTASVLRHQHIGCSTHWLFWLWWTTGSLMYSLSIGACLSKWEIPGRRKIVFVPFSKHSGSDSSFLGKLFDIIRLATKTRSASHHELRSCGSQGAPRSTAAPGDGMALAPARSPASSSCSFFFLGRTNLLRSMYYTFMYLFICMICIYT